LTEKFEFEIRETSNLAAVSELMDYRDFHCKMRIIDLSKLSHPEM